MKTTTRTIHMTLSFLVCLSLSAQIDVIAGDKVGIGNAKPTYKLDVVGSINFTDSIYQNGQPFNLNVPSLWQGKEGIIGYDGKVGIGTATPSSNLDVQGSINFTGDLLKGGEPMQFGMWKGGEGTAFYDGKVGIGTSTPQAALEIVSSSAGFLPPRLTKEQKETMETVIEGTIIFSINENCLSVYSKSDWHCLEITVKGNVELEDDDKDGVLNSNDKCKWFDDNMLGMDCNDGSPLTVDDKFRECFNCRGVFMGDYRNPIFLDQMPVGNFTQYKTVDIDLSDLKDVEIPSIATHVKLRGSAGNSVWGGYGNIVVNGTTIVSVGRYQSATRNALIPLTSSTLNIRFTAGHRTALSLYLVGFERQ